MKHAKFFLEKRTNRIIYKIDIQITYFYRVAAIIYTTHPISTLFVFSHCMGNQAQETLPGTHTYIIIYKY